MLGSLLVPTWSSWGCRDIMEKSRLSTLRVFHFEGSSLRKLLFFYVCRQNVLGLINSPGSPGRVWGLMPRSLYRLGPRLMLQLHGFVAKKDCSLE